VSTNKDHDNGEIKSHTWNRAVPLKFGIAWGVDDDCLYGQHRCNVTVYDEGNGRYLGVEFINEEPMHDENSHQGFFSTHADIRNFADNLHRMMRDAETPREITGDSS
jgi:hypothetical protein